MVSFGYVRGFDDFEWKVQFSKDDILHRFVLGSGCTPDVVFDAANVNVGEFKLN